MNKDKMNDSGERIDYGKGNAQREPDINKPRPELITPFGLERLAHWYRLGGQKYGNFNWCKGMPFSRYTASMFRHLIAWMKGDSSEDHLSAIAWNALAIIHHQELGEDKEWNDMPKWEVKD